VETRRTGSLPNSRSGSKRAITAFLVLLTLASEAKAADAYTLLSDRAKSITEQNHVNGWAYVVSGAVAVGISLPAFYLSEDLFAKVVYTAGQTVGVVAIGHGASLLMVEDEYTSFYRILAASRSLSPAERNELASSFFTESARRAKAARKIKVITLSIASALNVANAFGTQNSDLRTALFFLGGVNAIAAMNFAFKRSDEEKFVDSLARTEILVGTGVGVRVRF
jgi:hypothetical protein